MNQVNQFAYQSATLGQGVAIGGGSLLQKQACDTPVRVTLLTDYNETLRTRLANLHGLNDRLQRVADRVFGPVPEPNPNGAACAGSTCLASALSDGISDLDSIVERLERLVDRVEGI